MKSDNLLRIVSEVTSAFCTLVHNAAYEGARDALERTPVRTDTAGAPEPGVDPDRWVTTKDAARLAHVTPRTIRAWRRKNLLRAEARGRSYLFRVGDVLECARARARGGKVVDMKAEARRILKRRSNG